MSVNAWVYFFVAVSALSLVAVRLSMGRRMKSFFSRRWARVAGGMATLILLGQGAAFAADSGGGEANLTLPDLRSVNFFGMTGHALLSIGLLFCVAGLLFGLVIYVQLKNLPVHRTMREISEMIYETCKTYLVTQGKFILLLWVFIAVIIGLYFGVLAPVPGKPVGLTLPIILGFSLVGIAGSYGVAWFGIRVNTFANSRTAFAGLRGKPYPVYAIPLKSGMSIGMLLISVELLIMLFILLFIPRDYAGACFIGFAIGESLGAAALRIAGGIFTKIADIGADLMKIVFKIKEDDARNPGVIADCTGDNAGDSVGPSADGFETYGVTGVALITFILLAVSNPTTQVQLLVWIFVMRVFMLVSSAGAYFLNSAIAHARFANADEMDFETPLTSLVWITSIVSIILTYVVSYLMIPDAGGRNPVVETGFDHLVRNPGRRDHPRAGQGFHFNQIGSREGSRQIGAGGRSVAGNPVRICGGQFFSVLAGLVHGRAHEPGLLLHFGCVHGEPDAGSGSVRVRPGCIRISGHGTGHDRGGFLRAGDRQCSVRL